MFLLGFDQLPWAAVANDRLLYLIASSATAQHLAMFRMEVSLGKLNFLFSAEEFSAAGEDIGAGAAEKVLAAVKVENCTVATCQ